MMEGNSVSMTPGTQDEASLAGGHDVANGHAPVEPHKAGSGLSSAVVAAVTAHVDAHGGGEGPFPTPMKAVTVLKSLSVRMPLRRVYQPSLCVVLRGTKEILFGNETLHYGSMECLVVSVALPASGRVIEASPEEPFLGVTIDFDVAMIREVLEQMETPPAPNAADGSCVYVASVDQPLADCVIRLMRMAQNPKSIPILYPLVMREICYWLLSGERGGELCKLALPETQMERIAHAIQFLRENYVRPLRVEQLADAARMSVSSFHQHFKKLTSMTPLQYQKQMRLLEARRLMICDAVNVAEAAYKVGYESASQFSREYARMFGVPPKRSVMSMRSVVA